MKPSHLNISITPYSIGLTLLLLLLVAVLFALKDLVLVVLTAIVIASAIEPPTKFLMKFGLPRAVSVLAVYATVLTVLFSLAYIFLPPVVHESAGFAAALPQYAQTLGLEEFLVTSERAATTTPVNGEALNNDTLTPFETTLSIQEVIRGFSGAMTNITGGVYTAASSVFGGVFSFMLIIVLSFYFAVRETGLDDFIRLITPVKHQEYALSLWRRSQQKIGRWMQGQILLSLMVGLMVLTGLLLFNIPYAIVLAVFAAFMELIPVFGSIIAAVPAVAIAYFEGGTELAFIIVALYFVINQFQGNIVYPLVVQKVLGVPPLLVIIAIIAGGQLAGFLGIILSVPIAAALQEFIDDIQKKKEAELEKMHIEHV